MGVGYLSEKNTFCGALNCQNDVYLCEKHTYVRIPKLNTVYGMPQCLNVVHANTKNVSQQC